MLYRLFFRLVLRRIDPERAHALAFWALRRLPLPAAKVSDRLAVDVFGRSHRTPIGVAAGLDKDATAFSKLHKLGFGHVEVGTVTPARQPGNPKPRVFRLTEQRALINRMGFPSPGATAFNEAMGGRRVEHVIGVNVGKNRDTPLERASEDFADVVRLLGPVADFVVVNVSSPNTPGLRELQAIRALREILKAVKAQALDNPVLVKIAPDLADEDIDAIADLAIELDIAGIVCTNTTISRDGLTPGNYETGGLSGQPLKARSVAVLKRIRARAGDRLVLISVGGVSDAGDVWERLVAGASLVQVYTAFVYGGPLWPRRVNRDLLRRLDAVGATSIADVIGSQSES